jgi:hypothetical protein
MSVVYAQTSVIVREYDTPLPYLIVYFAAVYLEYVLSAVPRTSRVFGVMKQQPVFWAIMKSARLIIVLINGHRELEDIPENEGWMTV